MKLVIDPDVLKGAFLEGRREHIAFVFKIVELLKLIKLRRDPTASLPSFHLEIFVSYKSQDYEQVSYIVEALEAEEHKVWFDKKRLEPGEPWDPALESAIRRSNIFLYCISRHSKHGRNVQKEELNCALKVQKQELSDGKYIVPVLMEKVVVPAEISGLERVEFYEESGWLKLMSFLKQESDRLAGVQKDKDDEEKTLFLCEDEPPSRFSESKVAQRYRILLGGNEDFGNWYKDVREDFSAFRSVSGTGFPTPILLSHSCREKQDHIFLTVAVGAGSDGHLVSELGITKECLLGHLPGNCPTVQRLCSVKPDKVLSAEGAFECLKSFEKWLQEHI